MFKKRIKIKKFVCIFLLLLSIPAIFSCSIKQENKKEIQSIFELNDASYTIGVGVGSHAQFLVKMN